jgi:hypothetical protein
LCSLFFYLRVLVNPLVSSHSSYNHLSNEYMQLNPEEDIGLHLVFY